LSIAEAMELHRLLVPLRLNTPIAGLINNYLLPQANYSRLLPIHE